MNLSRILLYILLAFFLYKFVFNFLVPVLKMSWRVRRQIKEFQRQQQQPPVQQNTTTSSGRPSSTSSSAGNSAAPTPKGGEYIDFEEVKD